MGRFFGASLILGQVVKSGVGPILEFGLTLPQQCLLGPSNKKGQTTHDDVTWVETIFLPKNMLKCVITPSHDILCVT